VSPSLICFESFSLTDGSFKGINKPILEVLSLNEATILQIFYLNPARSWRNITAKQSPMLESKLLIEAIRKGLPNRRQ